MSDNEPNIRAIDPAKELGKKVITTMREHMADIEKNWGDTIVGFAIIAWDARGSSTCGWRTSDGPVSQQLLPTFVERAISHSLAVAVAKDL